MTIKLETLQGGALSEKIDCELKKIFENMKDPNTDLNKVRTLTITLKFKPNDRNEMVELTPSLKTTLVPSLVEPTTIIVDRDYKTNKVFAKEYNNQLKGQIDLDEVEKDLGLEVKETKIVDLRATK